MSTDNEQNLQNTNQAPVTIRRKNKTTSDTDRERIISAYTRGDSATEIAKILQVKRATIYEIIKKYQRTNVITAAKRGNNRLPKLSDTQKNSIKLWVNENCTLTLKSIVNKVMNEYNVSISKMTVSRILDGFHYSLKRLHLIPERRNCQASIDARRDYAVRFIALPSIYNEDELIFIDEVGFNVSMRTGRGRSEIGTQANMIVPQIRSKNISIVCAMNKNGLIYYEHSLRAINQESFIAFIEQLKLKIRHIGIRSAVFIMDNVRFHKTESVMNAINDLTTQAMYLPPYSPFLNPIENMFSKWKEITKRSNPQNEEELLNTIASGSNLVTSSECQGYFRHMCSYIPRCLNNEQIKN